MEVFTPGHCRPVGLKSCADSVHWDWPRHRVATVEATLRLQVGSLVKAPHVPVGVPMLAKVICERVPSGQNSVPLVVLVLRAQVWLAYPGTHVLWSAPRAYRPGKLEQPQYTPGVVGVRNVS